MDQGRCIPRLFPSSHRDNNPLRGPESWQFTVLPQPWIGYPRAEMSPLLRSYILGRNSAIGSRRLGLLSSQLERFRFRQRQFRPCLNLQPKIMISFNQASSLASTGSPKFGLVSTAFPCLYPVWPCLKKYGGQMKEKKMKAKISQTSVLCSVNRNVLRHFLLFLHIKLDWKTAKYCHRVKCY